MAHNCQRLAAAQGKPMYGAGGANRARLDPYCCGHDAQQACGRVKTERVYVRPLHGRGHYFGEDGGFCLQHFRVHCGQGDRRKAACSSCSFEKEGTQLIPGRKAKDRARVCGESAFLHLERARTFREQNGGCTFAGLQRARGRPPAIPCERAECPVASFEGGRPFVGRHDEDLLGAAGV
jgi:hypothetical protein